MRLIDADELDVSLYRISKGYSQYDTMMFYEISDLIDDAPTIEAIPMEYIEKFTATKNVPSLTVRIVLEIPEDKVYEMVKEWRWDHEARFFLEGLINRLEDEEE